MKITVNTIEGNTSKKGAKQNKTYTITGNKGIIEINGKSADLSNFYNATDGKNEFIIWDINKNWSKIGIQKKSIRRMSYTENFTIID